MTGFDLPDNQLRQLLDLIDAYLPDSEVWAYGSRVTGQSHAASDIDLVVRSPADPMRLGALKRSFSESNLPVLVDVLDWDALPPGMRANIERSHVVLTHHAT